MEKKGSVTCFPTNRKSNAGVTNIPARLLMTALHNEEATLPPAADVSMMHMLTVVGRHVRMRSPSRSVGGSKLGANFRMPLVTGSPTRNGQAANVPSWMAAFSLKLEKAFVNSDSSRDRPESKNMNATPNFPMNSSGRRKLPLLPNYNSRAGIQRR